MVVQIGLHNEEILLEDPRMLERFAFHLLATVLIVLDGPFWVYDLLRRAPIRFLESDTWTDEEIIRAVESAPYLQGSDNKLVQISEDTVVKFGRDWDSATSEALAMELVRKQTRIAIPPPGSLVITVCIGEAQSRFDNAPLPPPTSTGPTLFVHNIPGPLGPTPLPCNSRQFGYNAKGPFPTISALETYFRKDNAAEDRASRGWAPSPNCKPLDASAFASLNFTHDLNMRNFGVFQGFIHRGLSILG
ncbi:hypothetical protein EDD85DRAFT_961712 [Armillaria nabsnona]|nr:hypothetical protein EDD85DRAFT_961712 [Armillaria nabsnona]